VAIKREIAERHPWVILNLYKAFERANAIANQQRMEHIDYYIETGRLAQEAKNALTAPLVEYGVKANRRVLETAAQYSVEQGLTPRLLKLEEVFAPSTMEQ
jgi:4,5-dihydroxyphthalate decarboxylase